MSGQAHSFSWWIFISSLSFDVTDEGILDVVFTGEGDD